MVTGGGEAAGGTGGGGARVFFQSPRGGTGGSPESSSRSGSSREDSAPVATVAAAGQVQQQQRRHQQGKVTVKYDRKELRKRLVLEEWIVEQLGQLYGCEEEEMPDVEIDIDDLLDADSEEERASKLQEALVDCYKPTEKGAQRDGEMARWVKCLLKKHEALTVDPRHLWKELGRGVCHCHPNDGRQRQEEATNQPGQLSMSSSKSGRDLESTNKVESNENTC